MKRKIAWMLLVVLMLPGCGVQEDPYRVDTVVYIPVDPTETPTETTAETEIQTQPAQEQIQPPEETVPETTGSTKAQSGGSKTSGGKGSSGKGSQSGGKSDSSKATEPPVTETPATQPQPTEPQPTEPENALYDISGYSVGALEQAIADQINAYRAGEGLPPLGFDSYLSAIASARGYEASQYWSHTRPDGRSYATVLADYGYGAGTATELLVYGSGDAAAIVEKWMSSESHKNNLLSTSYTTVGVGIYSGGGVTVICCLLTG